MAERKLPTIEEGDFREVIGTVFKEQRHVPSGIQPLGRFFYVY